MEDNQIDNHNIFFLSNKQELEKNYKDNFFEKLKPLNNFTNTDPAYRSNLSIFFDKGGSSSFQSEYPFQMIYTNKSKFILSSLFMLSNAEAFNYLCLRNIFNEPIIEKFPLFFININEKKVLKEFQIETNMTNIIEIDKEFIKPEVFLVSKNYPCLPMFVSLKNGHISFEHTQAPHEYIMSADKFKTVKSLKKFVDDFIIR